MVNTLSSSSVHVWGCAHILQKPCIIDVTYYLFLHLSNHKKNTMIGGCPGQWHTQTEPDRTRLGLRPNPQTRSDLASRQAHRHRLFTDLASRQGHMTCSSPHKHRLCTGLSFSQAHRFTIRLELPPPRAATNNVTCVRAGLSGLCLLACLGL